LWRCKGGSEQQSTPRTRGSTQGSDGASVRGPVYPAHAGIDLSPQGILPPRLGLPRARGDRPAMLVAVTPDGRSTPRTRGSTPLSNPRRASQGSLPRARGDRPENDPANRSIPPSTPRTRGSTPRRLRACYRHGVYPAHAGIDRIAPLICCTSSGLPRARGDRPPRVMSRAGTGGSTPRTRGSTPPAPAHGARPKVYPAHAGIDLLSATSAEM